MSTQKESAIYLSFFRENLWLIAIPAISLTLAGFLYRQSQPVSHRLYALMEMDYRESELPQKTLLTDEAVTALRTDVIISGQSFGSQNRMRLYKVGPAAVNVEIEGLHPDGLRADFKKLADQAQAKYGFYQKGEIGIGVKQLPQLIFELGGLVAGMLFGVLTALIKTYLRKY